VKSLLKRHVFDADSALVLRKATDISVDDFVGPIGAVVEKGKGRTAGKIRSFLRAAYQTRLSKQRIRNATRVAPRFASSA
jgi:hypothetical protein